MMSDRSLSKRFTTRLNRLRYKYIVRRAWNAARDNAVDSHRSYGTSSQRLSDTTDTLIALSHKGKYP
jgi:hypothetical protein